MTVRWSGSGWATRAGVVAMAALALGACRDEELGRELRYEPGVYKGANPDKALSAEQLAELRRRAILQGGVTIGSGGGGGGPTSSDVRPPGAGGVDLNALRQRSRLQKGSGQ